MLYPVIEEIIRVFGLEKFLLPCNLRTFQSGPAICAEFRFSVQSAKMSLHEIPSLNANPANFIARKCLYFSTTSHKQIIFARKWICTKFRTFQQYPQIDLHSVPQCVTEIIYIYIYTGCPTKNLTEAFCMFWGHSLTNLNV